MNKIRVRILFYALGLLGAVLAAPAGAQEQTGADELIARYVEAIGGREPHASVSSMRSTGTLEVASMGLSGTFELLQHAPDRMILRAALPGVGEILNGFDGEVGWNVDPLTGARLLSGAELEARAERANLLATVRDPSLVPTRETVELTEYDGRECWRVRLVWASGRETFDCYSTETGLLVAAEETQMTQMGSIDVTMIYDEYRTFGGGVMLPSRLVQEGMGQTQVMIVDVVEIDTLEPGDLEPPRVIQTLMDGP